MNAFTDDVVQFDQAFDIVGFDIHQGVDAVIGFSVAWIVVFYLVTVPKKAIDTALEDVIGEHIFFGGSVSGVEDADSHA